MKTKKVPVAVIVLVLLTCILAACSKPVAETETEVAIVAVKSIMNDAESATLLGYMDALVKKGQLTYGTDDAGMLTSLNGKEAKMSDKKYWMIYTSAAEYGNDAWGTYEYEGKTLKSTTLGITDLPIKEGEVYLFVITDFSNV